MTKTDTLRAALLGFYEQACPARLGIAVSGGSDSLALLHLLADWAGAELHVATVDHRLRPESAGEAAHVAAICEGLGLPHTVLTWDGWDGKGNLQDQARRTRYSLLADWAREAGLNAVALGHTRDDVAETFLMRLARGAGVDGLSAMAAQFRRDGAVFHRPILTVSREDLRRFLIDRRVRWADDPSNEDTAFDRVKARQALRHLAPLGLDADSIAMTAGHLSDARYALAKTASDWAGRAASVVAGDLVFDRTALKQLPGELRHRILSGALQWVSMSEYPPRRAPLADVEAAVSDRRNTVLHGCRVMVTDMTVRITREYAAVADHRTAIGTLWDGRWAVTGDIASTYEIGALGDAVMQCPGWRDTGLPRASLLASPAVWDGEILVAAPVAGLKNGWAAEIAAPVDFAAALMTH